MWFRNYNVVHAFVVFCCFLFTKINNEELGFIVVLHRFRCVARVTCLVLIIQTRKPFAYRVYTHRLLFYEIFVYSVLNILTLKARGVYVGRNLWICAIHESRCAIYGSILCAGIHGSRRNLWIALPIYRFFATTLP